MAEEATVGSISHILHTAFKDVYDDFHKRSSAKQARIDREIAADIEKQLKLAEPEPVVPEPVPEPVPVTAKAKGKPTKGKPVPEPEPVPEPIPEPVTEPEPIIEPPKDDIADYYSKFEKMDLNEHNLSDFAIKVAHIEEEVVLKQQSAKDLVEYLQSQKVIAYNLEVEEEENLKRQGVMVGQHIPGLPSKLNIEPTVLNKFGNFSNNLIIAKEFVRRNKEENLRRTGNLPISQLAEDRKADRGKYQEMLESDVPHYLETTEVTTERSRGTLNRFRETMKAQETLKLSRQQKEVEEGRVKPPKKIFPKRNDLLNAEQKFENEEILKSINHKLNYLRNPRGNPNLVARTLVKGSVQNREDEDVELHKSSQGTATVRSSKSSSKSKKSYGKPPPVTDCPLFVTEPKILHFTGYDVGSVCTQSVYFRNVSAISRQVRFIPPATKYFTMSQLKFPANCKGGIVAPGMAVISFITFYPDSLGDFNDILRVETEGGSYQVTIQLAFCLFLFLLNIAVVIIVCSVIEFAFSFIYAIGSNCSNKRYSRFKYPRSLECGGKYGGGCDTRCI